MTIVNLGCVLIHRGRLEEAEPYIQRGLGLSFDARYLLGIVFARSHLVDLALWRGEERGVLETARLVLQEVSDRRLGRLSSAYTDRKEFWTLDGDVVRWLGVVLFVAGGALRIWPVYVLGRRFSGLVAIQPEHKLVTSGIYGVIRHPSYLGLIVNALGWALAFRAGVGLLLAGLTIPPLLARIRAEEALLHAQFGAEYDAYRSRTSRLVPGLY